MHTSVNYTAHGAHLLEADSSCGPLLFLSRKANYASGAAIRGGVPIIAPQFAEFLDGQRHGWARTMEWNIEDTEEGYRASLNHDDLVLGLAVRAADDGFSMQLSAENTAETSRRLQLAFHPYFQVEDVEEISVEGLEGETITDRLSASQWQGPKALAITGETDVIVQSAPAVRIIDNERIITITNKGADSLVLWNPGEAKADSLSDLAPLEWKNFLCVEPAFLGEGQRGTLLTPGEINSLEMHVGVEAR